MQYRFLALPGLFVSSAAFAHVKWFEAYEVASSPVPILTTLSLPYFWLGLVLVLDSSWQRPLSSSERPAFLPRGE
jgi:hypothetical protein